MDAARETWFLIQNRSNNDIFAFGTAEDAQIYCDYLNRDRDQNVYHPCEVTDPAVAAMMESGGAGVACLEELVAAINDGSIDE